MLGLKFHFLVESMDLLLRNDRVLHELVLIPEVHVLLRHFKVVVPKKVLYLV
jgi:hypothetical protein